MIQHELSPAPEHWAGPSPTLIETTNMEAKQDKMNAIYKGVVYAYPDSPCARDFGRSQNGCWVVVVFSDSGPVCEDLVAFDAKPEAEAFARSMQQDWHPYFAGI